MKYPTRVTPKFHVMLYDGEDGHGPVGEWFVGLSHLRMLLASGEDTFDVRDVRRVTSRVTWDVEIPKEKQ